MLVTLAAGSVLSVRAPLALSVAARAPLLRCAVRCCASESELSALTVVKLKEKLRAALPYGLTGAQERAIAALLQCAYQGSVVASISNAAVGEAGLDQVDQII